MMTFGRRPFRPGRCNSWNAFKRGLACAAAFGSTAWVSLPADDATPPVDETCGTAAHTFDVVVTREDTVHSKTRRWEQTVTIGVYDCDSGEGVDWREQILSKSEWKRVPGRRIVYR